MSRTVYKKILIKKRSDTFVSFRNSRRNLENELRLNVRRGLAAVHVADTENNTQNIDEMSVISGQLDNVSIDEMTAENFYNDKRAHFQSHQRHLKDKIYTKKWWKAICGNRHLFEDKIVLDVTCGLGMLSMFSAIAGAKHVYAIDTSNVVQLTRRIVADNQLTHKITVIKGKASEITLPDKVDIIVSSFLGETLLIENHLDELIDAREKWLVPDGLILPDRCSLYIMALDNQMPCDRSNFWQHVYTFDMRSIAQAGISEPYYKRLESKQIVSTSPCLIKHINLYTVEKHDYRRFDTPFRLDCKLKTCIGALATYFDVEFNEGLHPIRFSTAPELPQTQWPPLVFYLTGNDFHLDKGDRFYGVFRFNAHDNDTRNRIIFDWNIEVMHKSENSYFRDKWTFNRR